jgi:hypothetical protein
VSSRLGKASSNWTLQRGLRNVPTATLPPVVVPLKSTSNETGSIVFWWASRSIPEKKLPVTKKGGASGWAITGAELARSITRIVKNGFMPHLQHLLMP